MMRNEESMQKGKTIFAWTVALIFIFPFFSIYSPE
ncbi:unnamed protein product [Spirodela intermedia]|uniref:Uncharacterized protein n=1 Tax=Spirodela intermedia TaxID=51605 RepID=A0A7I8L812_SPIIN|nr:unnamed protein product [Spirodela intermedia]